MPAVDEKSPPRRKQLVEATIALVLEAGLRATKTRDVTERAGVGTGLLNHYFRWPELRALAWRKLFEAVISAQFNPTIRALIWNGISPPRSTKRRDDSGTSGSKRQNLRPRMGRCGMRSARSVPSHATACAICLWKDMRSGAGTSPTRTERQPA